VIVCEEYNSTHLTECFFVTGWDDILKIANGHDWAWRFRGQSCAKWGLKTTFERAGKTFPINEQDMLLKCRRGAVNYLSRPLPADNDYYSWLNIMQHFGGATRLLDVSRSAFIALFFAVCDMQPNSDACLWCILLPQHINGVCLDIIDWQFPSNPKDFILTFKENESIGIAFANEILRSPEQNGTIKKTTEYNWNMTKVKQLYDRGGCLLLPPQLQTKRSLAQQGEFLFPINLEKTFEQNMLGMLAMSDKYDFLDDVEYKINAYGHNIEPGVYPFNIQRFIIPYSLRGKILSELRKMNIAPGTLFPDISGFFKDIAYNLYAH